MSKKKRCPVEDDKGRKCTNQMSKHEEDQDGMCGRCASLIWEQ